MCYPLKVLTQRQNAYHAGQHMKLTTQGVTS